MGEVYRARDTRLDGTVAIKVLPNGLIYVLTDGAFMDDPTARDAALLRIEPVE